MQQFAKFALLATLLTLICSDPTGADRQPKRIQGPAATGGNGSFSSPCGTASQMSFRIGGCVLPILELVEGKVPDPKSDADIVAVCDRFGNSEKCVRSLAKDCLSGIHKASTSSIATATKRYRNLECKTAASRAKYIEPLKCANRKAAEMTAVNRNVTAIAQAIRDLRLEPEEKILKICCLLNMLDKEIESRYNRDCPGSTAAVLGIVHAMTDDARATLCRNPKCATALNGLTQAKYKPPQNLMEPIMQILFMISTE